MSIEFIFYIILPIFSFFICSILALWLNHHYKSVGSKEITTVFALNALWAILSVFQLLDISEQSSLWFKLSFIPISLIPVYWLQFAINYSHQKQLMGNTAKIIITILPAITMLFIWIPGLQHEMWKTYTLETHHNLSFIVSEKGNWFWIYLGYLYSLLLLGISVILIRLNIYESLFRKQTMGIIIGFFIPFVANVVFDTSIIPNMLGDITPSFLGLSAIIILFSMNMHRLFDILPEPPTAIFHHSNDGIIVLDPQYRIISANEAFSTLLNLDLKPFIGWKLEEVFPDWKEKIIDNVDENMPENIYLFSFGHSILEARITSYQDKSKSGYLIYIRDITTIVRAQEEILFSQKKYKSLYENMLTSAMVFSTHDNGNTFHVISINKYAELKLELPEEEVLGKTFDEVYTSKEFQMVKEAIKQVWQTGESSSLPVLKSIHDDRPVWKEYNVYKLSTDEVIVICKDITEEMLAKETLTSINEDLEIYVDQLENFSTEILLLNQFGNRLQSCKTYDEVANSLGEYSHKLLHNHSLGLLILDITNNKNNFSNVSNPEFFQRVFSQTLFLETLEENIVNQYEEESIQQILHLDIAFPYTCYVSKISQDKLCILVLDDKAENLDHNHRQYIHAIADRIVSTIANIDLQEQLKFQALHDEITCFYNRRYMNESLPRELHRAKRYGHMLTFLMIDIDYFKSFNDTYGHLIGDQILEKISQVIRNMVRNCDMLFRYGGEEFLAIFPETGIDEALNKAQAIRTAISNEKFMVNGVEIPSITVSGGISNFPYHGDTLESLVNKADQAMYMAKNNGRNQIIVLDIDDDIDSTEI